MRIFLSILFTALLTTTACSQPLTLQTLFITPPPVSPVKIANDMSVPKTPSPADLEFTKRTHPLRVVDPHRRVQPCRRP